MSQNVNFRAFVIMCPPPPRRYGQRSHSSPRKVSGTKTFLGCTCLRKTSQHARDGCADAGAPEQRLCRETLRGRRGYPGQTQSSFTNISGMLSGAVRGGRGLFLQQGGDTGPAPRELWVEDEQEVMRGYESKPYDPHQMTSSHFLLTSPHNPRLGRSFFPLHLDLICWWPSEPLLIDVLHS